MKLIIDYRQQISALHNQIKITFGNTHVYCDEIEFGQNGTEYVTLYLFSKHEVIGIIPIEDYDEVDIWWKC